MSRCSKCNGYTSMWEVKYRPNYCKDPECPEGEENPDKRTFIEKLEDLRKESNNAQKSQSLG